jgi:gas vesicle protein
MDVITFLSGFLIGVATGAAGTYMADKYTDRRRESQAERERRKTFEKVVQQMPKLIAEMKADLTGEGNQAVREFFVIPQGANLNVRGKMFTYHPEQHENLEGKLATLQNRQYIIDVTPGNAKKYRMSEEFVELVLNS